MMVLYKTFKALIKDQRGATAIEYGLIVALISSTIIGLISIDGGVAGSLETIFVTISETFDSVVPSGEDD